MFGVCRQTIYKYAKKHGIKLSETIVLSDPIDLNALRDLNEQGFSDAEISKILCCSSTTVTKWRCRLGLPSAKTKQFNMRLRNRKIVAEDQQPEVRSEESLYCDTEFLENYFGKKLDG